MKLEFSEGKNTLCLPHKTDVAQSQTQKQRSKRTETKSTKRKNERGNHLCVPGKMNMIFLGTVAQPCACHAEWTLHNSLVAAGKNMFLEFEKNTFCFHGTGLLKGRSDDPSDGET
jgi:hypothetical protein